VKREIECGTKGEIVNFNDWMNSVPAEISGDSLWKMEAYRLALFASDLGWHDVTKLLGDKRTLDLSSQLYRALGSVGANLAEGYSRGTGRDRARFYEYALGSARESRDWYYKGRHVLADKVVQHRLGLMTEIIRLLLKTVPEQRGGSLKEEAAPYYCDGNEDSNEVVDRSAADNLFENIPMS
jgi:four helix bundle protein